MSVSKIMDEQRECPLIRFIPKANETGNSAAKNRAQIDRDNLIGLVNLMWWNPRQRGDVLGLARGLVAEDDATKSLVGEDIFSEVSTLAKMDDDIMGRYHAKHLDVKECVMGKVKAFDAQGIKQITQFVLVANLNSPVPPEARSRTVFTKSLDSRVTAAGNRYSMVRGTCFVRPSGELDWSYGVYEVTFKKGPHATHITHRPTNTQIAIQAKYKISEEHELENNWSDFKARFVRDDHVVCAWKLFKKNQGGPHHQAVDRRRC